MAQPTGEQNDREMAPPLSRPSTLLTFSGIFYVFGMAFKVISL